MRKMLFIAIACCLSMLPCAYAQTHVTPQRANDMKISLTIENKVLTATLNNTQAAQDFYTQLPLTLTLEDYASAEKISTLPKALRTADSPAGSRAGVGDIAYYAPWGNLVLFYQGVPYGNGLIILGHIHGEVSVLRGRSNLRVRIEAAQ